jgi:hypothetical protein
MNFHLGTYAVLGSGLFLAILYVLILAWTGRSKDISSGNFVLVLLSGSSIVAGLKLIVNTFMAINNNLDTIETDKIYTILGGGTVVFISIQSFLSKVRKPVK